MEERFQIERDDEVLINSSDFRLEKTEDSNLLNISRKSFNNEHPKISEEFFESDNIIPSKESDLEDDNVEYRKGVSSDADIIGLYLDDVKRHPLLKAEEEYQTAKAMSDSKDEVCEILRTHRTFIRKIIDVIQKSSRSDLIIEMLDYQKNSTENKKKDWLLLALKHIDMKLKSKMEQLNISKQFIWNFSEELVSMVRNLQKDQEKNQVLLTNHGFEHISIFFSTREYAFNVDVLENDLLDLVDFIEDKRKIHIESYNKLIRSNLRLVVNFSKRYKNFGISFMDLIQEGNMGLMKALNKFEYQRGYKFSTYASWWIRQSILRTISDHCRTIRIPDNVVDLFNKYTSFSQTYFQENGENPGLDKITENLNTPWNRLSEALDMFKFSVSLDSPISDDTSEPIMDIYPDENTEKPDEHLEKKNIDFVVKSFLKNLNKQEKAIIKLRFGLGRKNTHTLEEIGSIMSLSRERIRQIEKVAIEKMQEMEIYKEAVHCIT